MRHASSAQVQAMHWPVLEPIEPDSPTNAPINPIALSKPVCVAGARSRVNLPLDSPLVSRAHALFVTGADGVYVRDLASLNHVFLNETPVREAELREGDVIRIGPFAFRCQSGFSSVSNGHAPPAQLQQVGSESPIELSGRSTVIGSRKGCDVHLSGSAVEPVHAVIFEREGHWHLRDLRSSTGTYANDELIGQIELKPGDLIRVGDVGFRFQVGAEREEVELPEVIDTSAPAAAEPSAEQAPAAAEAPSLVDSTIPLLDEAEMGQPSPLSQEQRQPIPAPAEPALPEPSIPEPEGTQRAVAEPAAVPDVSSQAPEPPLAEDELIPVHHDPGEPESPEGAGGLIEPFPVDQDLARPATQTTEADELSQRTPAEAATSQPEEKIRPEEYPGTKPHEAVEEHFSELLDGLSQNVEQLQSTWKELKTNGQAPVKPPPGTEGPSDRENRRNEPEPPIQASRTKQTEE